jgi:eukaryotic-like serine/threonine-protein kinase
MPGVCSAVAYAHRNLVVHRDLKPSNILVTADRSPHLLDFGIAKLLEDGDQAHLTTAVGAFPLTPGYSNPERIEGRTITTASDIFSLGILLYELTTGTHPFLDTDLRRQSLVASRGAGSDEIGEQNCASPEIDSAPRDAARVWFHLHWPQRRCPPTRSQAFEPGKPD